jgi:Predicted ornithine cyclodeaminase, mu-crystallin homolog
VITLDNDQVRKNLPWPRLVAAIAQALRDGSAGVPARSSFELADRDGSASGHLLIMPAWIGDEMIGMKTVTYWPDNPHSGLPSHCANYILMQARTGEILAVLEGEELTVRRTAAVSVIAAMRLMRGDVRRLLIVGAGPIAASLAEAYSAFHDFDSIDVYARRRDRAEALIADLAGKGLIAKVCDNLQAAVERADVISMATSAREPVLKGAWIAPGTHIDLVGSFTPQMRETDDELVRRADAIWIDTDVALSESGDLTQPMATGVLRASAVKGNLERLLGSGFTRRPEDITVFKAVGFGLTDLAAARCALAGAEQPQVQLSA